MKFNPYLIMDQNAEEAILKYAKAFNAEYQIMKYKDAPPDPNFEIPESMKDLVMHGEVRLADMTIMVSDATQMMPMPLVKGNNVQIALTIETTVTLDDIYEVLGEGAEVYMAPQETFFAEKYVSFVDSYGINWQLIVSKPLNF